MAEINEIVSNKAIEDAIKLLNTLGVMGDKMENVIKNTDAMKKKLDEIGTSSSDATVKTTAYQNGVHVSIHALKALNINVLLSYYSIFSGELLCFCCLNRSSARSFKAFSSGKVISESPLTGSPM